MSKKIDNELLTVWRNNGFTLRLWNTYTRVDGKQQLAYELKDGRKVIFEGNDFYAPGDWAWDLKTCVYSLLVFLSLQEGDTDSEYFDNYTPEQIAWRDSSRGEELQMIVFDCEERQERKRSRARGK